jgi:hypothetical protein
MAAKLFALAAILALYCSLAVDAQSQLPWNGGIWQQKMVLFFNQYDLNRNGLQDLDDENKLVAAFSTKPVASQTLARTTVVAMWKALYINQALAAPGKPRNAATLIACLNGILLVGMTADVTVFAPDYFLVLDTDTSGFLSSDEWSFYFTTAQNMSASIVGPSFTMFDTSGNNLIDSGEFKTGIMNYYTTSDPNNKYNTFLGPVDVTNN